MSAHENELIIVCERFVIPDKYVIVLCFGLCLICCGRFTGICSIVSRTHFKQSFINKSKTFAHNRRINLILRKQQAMAIGMLEKGFCKRLCEMSGSCCHRREGVSQWYCRNIARCEHTERFWRKERFNSRYPWSNQPMALFWDFSWWNEHIINLNRNMDTICMRQIGLGNKEELRGRNSCFNRIS